MTCGTSLTPTLVKNFAEEINRSRFRKNLTIQFIQRHLVYLKILYLRNIDNLQKKQSIRLIFSYFIGWYIYDSVIVLK